MKSPGSSISAPLKLIYEIIMNKTILNNTAYINHVLLSIPKEHSPDQETNLDDSDKDIFSYY